MTILKSFFMLKKIFFFYFGLVLALSSVSFSAQAESAFFSDTVGSLYHTAISDLYAKKILHGYADNTFQPENSINRAEFMKILIEAIQSDFSKQKLTYPKDCFSDVPVNDWYAPYVCFAKNQKIISGYSDGTFRPSAEINLAEAVKMIVNAFQLPPGTIGEEWYTVYLNAMGNLNYIPPTFKTLSQTVNRGEMAEMIWRVLEDKRDQTCSSVEKLLQAPCQVLGENLPQNIDMSQVRKTWLAWNNAVRQSAGKAPYVYNAQLNRSATIWSEYVKTRGYMDHKRPGQTAYYDYNLIKNWFKNLGLTFQNKSGVTFTENIGWGFFTCSASDCTEEMLASIRTTFDFFMAEKNKAYRPHYDSVMNDSFQEIGLGIALKDGKYYLTVHYGTQITSEPLPVCQ